VEVIADRAVALPPLTTALARELIGRTRVQRLLAGCRDRPPANARALERTLMRLAQLATDEPHIVELDINPLLADARGAVALDARVRIDPTPGPALERLAIRPYPREQEQTIGFHGRTVLLRPIRPEDEPRHRAFIARIDAQDMRLRFFHAIKGLSPRELAHLTQLDYERAMAFIAEAGADGAAGEREILGVVRAHFDPDNVAAQFAILVRSDLKGRGLGAILLDKLIAYCRERGLQRLEGDVLPGNAHMLALARKLGFELQGRDRDRVQVILRLQPGMSAPP
jgi:acetyltransferase